MSDILDHDGYEDYEDGIDPDEDEAIEPAPGMRFVRISEDVVVDVLTGNQYMPAR